MQLRIVFSVTVLIFAGCVSTIAQTSQQEPDRIWLTKKISVPRVNERGCTWASSSVWAPKKPKDLGGLILYLIRGALGKNKVQYTAHYNCPPTIKEFRLNKSELLVTADEPMRIVVFAMAIDDTNDPINYEFSVSGGRILGTGNEVVWDLSGVRPGRYFIKVCANNGTGCKVPIGTNVQTKQVFVMKRVKEKN